MLAISNFPDWMKGELYNNMNLICDGDGDYENPIIEKQLKTDLTIHNLTDILKIIDTCHYIGVELPFEVLDYVLENNTNLLEEIENMETDNKPTPYDYFLTTPEFTAVRLIIYFTSTYAQSISSDPSIYMPNIILNEKWCKECISTNVQTCSDPSISVPNSILNEKWCKEFMNEKWCKEFMKYAIRQNSLLLVRFLYKKYEKKFYIGTLRNYITMMLITTAKNGCVEIMNFWREQKWFCSATSSVFKQEELIMYSVSYNEMPMLKYLLETLRFKWNHWENRIFDMALQRSNIDCIRYLLEQKCPIPRTILRKSIIYRYSFENIRILIEEVKVSLDDPMYTLLAVENGDLNLVKYLHEKNAPWHDEVVNMAFQYGLIKIAKYCVDNGAPYDINVLALYEDTVMSKKELTEWVTFLHNSAFEIRN